MNKIKTKIKALPYSVINFLKNNLFPILRLGGVGGVVLLIVFIYSIWWFKILYYKLALNIWSHKMESLELSLKTGKANLEILKLKQECLKKQYVRLWENKKVKVWYCR